MIPLNVRKYLRGGLGRIETFTFQIPCSTYKRFWTYLDEKWVENSYIEFRFHYVNLPKRVDRDRRKRVLGNFLQELFENDFYCLNRNFQDDGYLEPFMREMVWDWLLNWSNKKNLKKHLWLVEALENGEKFDYSKVSESTNLEPRDIRIQKWLAKREDKNAFVF